LRSRQRHRHRPCSTRARIRDVPAASHAGRIRGHGRRARDLQEDRRSPRGADLGRFSARSRQHLLLHDSVRRARVVTLVSSTGEEAGSAATSARAHVFEPSRRPVEVLVVEDSADWAGIVRDLLDESSPGSFSISTCERLASACAHLGQARTDCVLLDLSLPDARGIDALRELLRIAPSVPVVVLSALDDEDVAFDAVQQGAQDYLVKGRADGHLLNRAVRYAIERKRVEAELAVSRELGRRPLTRRSGSPCGKYARERAGSSARRGFARRGTRASSAARPGMPPLRSWSPSGPHRRRTPSSKELGCPALHGRRKNPSGSRT
jgi:CheY-like chemotaxis protein